jgi:hypothetical protein
MRSAVPHWVLIRLMKPRIVVLSAVLPAILLGDRKAASVMIRAITT